MTLMQTRRPAAEVQPHIHVQARMLWAMRMACPLVDPTLLPLVSLVITV